MRRGNDSWNLILGFPLIAVSRFLLVSLNIDSILQESTIYQRKERLRKMGDGSGLEDAYSATIERIKAQGGGNRRLAMDALMWVSHAERPLMADELCHALAVELGSTNFNAENVPSMSTLISCCQGLITVDKEASTVRLIHFTLKEYLSARIDMFGRPHSAMAEICLTYLNLEEVKALSAVPAPHIFRTSFLRYCSRNWGVHANRELSDHARSLTLHLLQEYDGHISAKSLLEQIGYTNSEDSVASFRFSGLHCASFFGIVEIVALFIEGGNCDINEEDLWGNTPLTWATTNGHEGAVKALLRLAEVNPDKPNGYGLTPLLIAAHNGYAGIVKILLERCEVNPDRADSFGGTPLQNTSRGGYEQIVKALLTREEVNPNKPNNQGSTPLLLAAQYRHEDVVEILLGREEVNPEKPDNYGRTPLQNAALGGHEGIVKALLAREEVDPDRPDNHGSTPLSIAAQYGHENMVEILLRREVNPEKPDNYGGTPLQNAALGGHEGIIKALRAKKSTPTGQTITVVHRSRLLLSMDMKVW